MTAASAHKRQVLWAGLHVGALWAIVVVQPLFDLLGGTPGFFVARGNTRGEVLTLALGWTFVPPLVALLVLAAAHRVGGRAFTATRLTLVGGLVAVGVLQPLAGLPPVAGIVLALAAGAALTAAYARLEPLRSFVSFLGVAPVVVLVLFLSSAPVRDVVFAPDEADAAAASIGNPKPVVVLVFDELPTLSLMRAPNRIDAERYPNFARLARTSTWYPNATSVADGTYVAVPAILTGDQPPKEIPARRTYPESLFTLLGKDYDLHVQEPMTVVCPQNLCGARDRAAAGLRTLVDDLSIVERRLLYPDDWADDLPPIDRDFAGFAPEAGDLLAQERVDQARAVVETMKPSRPGDDPGLWFVHFVIPHVPWEFVADGDRYGVEGPSIPGLEDQTWGDNRFLLDQAFQRDAEMTRFADTLLGETLDQLEDSNLFDDALIVVTADHGGAIGPNQSRRPVTEDNFAKVAGVPMFVKTPSQTTARVSNTFVRTTDVLPTVAAVLEAGTNFTFDGRPVDERRDPILRQRNGRTSAVVERTPAQFRRAFDAALAAQVARFPPGLDSLQNVGPDGTPGGPARVDIDGNGSHYVTGTTQEPDGTPLALTTGDRLLATGEAYDGRFSFFLPRGRPGDVAVRLLV